MAQANLTVRFHTPAFLGDAHQQGAWRTPPFKAQLRAWWRVAMAARGAEWASIKAKEGWLFGSASDRENASRRSAVRLRLGQWRPGQLREWPGSVGASVGVVDDGKNKVGADLYLGFGAVQHGGKGKPPRITTGREPAIDAGESNSLRLAYPGKDAAAEEIPALEEALGLIDRLGTIGGRSRNGWGSVALDGAPGVRLGDYARDWQSVLEHSAPIALGRDATGVLAWSTQALGDWTKVITRLGQIRKDLCRESQARTLLSHPVTKHTQRNWGANARVPNSLRFKVVRGEAGLHGLIYHMPCRPSDELWDKLPDEDKRRFPDVWAEAHQQLDDNNNLERVAD